MIVAGEPQRARDLGERALDELTRGLGAEHHETKAAADFVAAMR